MFSSLAYQALQDSHASILPSPRPVDNDATVEEIPDSSVPVIQVTSPVDVIPVNRSNLESVREPDGVIPADQSNSESIPEPLEQVQQLPSAEVLASNQDTGGEMQISAEQVEALSTPVDALSAGQLNPDPVMEPLEQLQQISSAQANVSNHESGELLQQMQQLPPAETPNSTCDPSLATEIEPRSNNENSLSCHVPSAPMGVTNQNVLHPASNSELDSHTPVGAIRTESETRNLSTPSEINNHLRQTSTQSMNTRQSLLDNDPLKNELDRLSRESEQTKKNYEDMVSFCCP